MGWFWSLGRLGILASHFWFWFIFDGVPGVIVGLFWIGSVMGFGVVGVVFIFMIHFGFGVFFLSLRLFAFPSLPGL